VFAGAQVSWRCGTENWHTGYILSYSCLGDSGNVHTDVGFYAFLGFELGARTENRDVGTGPVDPAAAGPII